MEALWGRFCPAQQALRLLIRSGAIGEPLQGDARCAFDADFVRCPDSCQPCDETLCFGPPLEAALFAVAGYHLCCYVITEEAMNFVPACEGQHACGC